MDGMLGRNLEDYLFALSAVAVAAIVTALIWPPPGTAPPAFFYVAVAAAAGRGGRGPGLAAVIGSALVVASFFPPAYGPLPPSRNSTSSIAVFLGASALIGWLASSRRGSREGERAFHQWLREFMEPIAEAAVFADSQGRITHLNPLAQRLTGWSSDEARGRPAGEVVRLVDERTRDRRDPIAEILATGRAAAPADSILISRTGAEVPVSEAGSPLWEAPEKLWGAVMVVRDVPRRKLAEEALRVGEERYRALFNSVDEGFCVIEILFDDRGRPNDLRYLEANPAFETLTGEREVVGRTPRELRLGHEEIYRDDWFEIYGRVALTGEPARFANLEPAVGGRWYDLHAFRVGGDDDGHRVAIRFRNITEIVLAERERGRLTRELENQRAELARLIESAPAFIAVLRGPNHVYELANAKLYELLGRRDLIGRTVAEAVPEADAQGFVNILNHVYETGEEHVGRETPFHVDRTGSGVRETRRINFVYQATRDPDGSITGVFVHGVDITEHVEAIRAVKESEARFRQMADAMPQAIWTARPDGEIEFLNRNFLEYTGFPNPPIRKEKWRGLVHPDDYERAAAAWRGLFGSDQPIDLEYRLKRASDGRYRWHLARALSIKNESGEVVRWIGTNTDIDDFKRLSESIKEADRHKDEFLAMLAHELRNPLAPIRTGLQILKMNPKEEVFASTVEMMTRQLGHMIHLVDDLLDVARVGSGKIVLRKERVTLRSVVETALEASREAIDAKHHNLTVRIADVPIHLEADPTRIAQVISNLLTNAAKYTRKEGRIEVSANLEDGEAVVRVKDTGDGIEAEMLTRVFEMFSQVGSSIGHSQGGLGIGLTVVKRLVELHGGRIEARSEGLGHGSEFIVRLPIAAGGGERESRPAPGLKDEMRKKLRVLVVDDNRDSADTLAKVVGLADHEVKTAYDGEEAVAVAESFAPDIVLLDIGLPGLNGYQVAERLRQNSASRKTTLVAVTGWGRADDRSRSAAAGFDLHFVKPVDLGLLQTLLESGVDAARRKAAELGARRPRQNGARSD